MDYIFKLSAADTALIGHALDLMPMGKALPIALYMQSEIYRQDAVAAAEQQAAIEREKINACAEAVAARLSAIEQANAAEKALRNKRQRQKSMRAHQGS